MLVDYLGTPPQAVIESVVLGLVVFSYLVLTAILLFAIASICEAIIGPLVPNPASLGTSAVVWLAFGCLVGAFLGAGSGGLYWLYERAYPGTSGILGLPGSEVIFSYAVSPNDLLAHAGYVASLIAVLVAVRLPMHFRPTGDTERVRIGCHRLGIALGVLGAGLVSLAALVIIGGIASFRASVTFAIVSGALVFLAIWALGRTVGWVLSGFLTSSDK